MNTCIVGGHQIELYSGIDEMPMANYHKFNKYIMFESGLAPDANGVIGHLSKMNELLMAKEYDKLGIELQSTYQSVHFIMNELSPVSMAFACMVRKIDGKEVNDLSDDAIRLLSYKLNRERAQVIREKVKEFKKKLNTNSKPTLRRLFKRAQKSEQPSA